MAKGSVFQKGGGGSLTGGIKILGGIITGNKNLIMDGLEDIFSSVLGSVFIIVLQFIAVIQTIFVLQKERSLTAHEKEIVKKVFKKSLSVKIIRIVEGNAGLFGWISERPFTLGNTIYLKDYRTNTHPDVFVQECIHVWQYQHLGVRYISEAAFSQAYYQQTYNWVYHFFYDGVSNWKDFNKESQGKFFEDLYQFGEMICGTTVTSGNGAFFDAEDQKCLNSFVFQDYEFTAFANETVKYVRDKKNYRWLSLNQI